MHLHTINRFMRTQAVAVVATMADFAVSWLLLWLFPSGDEATAVAVASGAVTGAVVACALNHIWSFRGNGNAPFAVAMRYALVWVGSVLINTFGTVLLSHHLSPVILAKAVVAVVVGCMWNYPLMSAFVYRSRSK